MAALKEMYKEHSFFKSFIDRAVVELQEFDPIIAKTVYGGTEGKMNFINEGEKSLTKLIGIIEDITENKGCCKKQNPLQPLDVISQTMTKVLIESEEKNLLKGLKNEPRDFIYHGLSFIRLSSFSQKSEESPDREKNLQCTAEIVR